jgi:hypothetical protein
VSADRGRRRHAASSRWRQRRLGVVAPVDDDAAVDAAVDAAPAVGTQE